MASYDVVDYDGLEGPVKKVRKALGATAFGVNYFDLPPDTEGHAHDETDRDHEEVYVYVRGSGRLRLDGEEIEVRAGQAVRVDPEVRRQPVSGDQGLAWVAVGAPRDGKYEPPSWG
jgi:mannose-6-phosphate isomerase-like protein (cupin superfamily)